MRLDWLLIFLFFLWSGCASDSDRNVVKISVHTESEGQMADYFQKAQAVFLETNDHALISVIDKIILGENRIFVLGNFLQNIFIFDGAGKHISTIEAQGRGAGEYIMVQDVSVDYDKKELILLASVPLKLMFFDFQGNLKQEYKLQEGLRFQNVTVDKNQILARYFSDKDSCVSMGIWNTEKKKFEELKEAGMIQKWKCPVVMEGFHMLKGEQLNCVMDFDRTIYTYTNGTLKPRYELDFGRDNFVNPWMNEMKSSEFLGKVMGNYVFRLQNVKETPDYIFYSINNGKGLGFIDKQLNQSVLCRQMKDEELQLTINRMTPLEDPENRWFGCMFPASYLQKIVDKTENLLTTKKEFVDKVKVLEEDSNPVLLLYKSK